VYRRELTWIYLFFGAEGLHAFFESAFWGAAYLRGSLCLKFITTERKLRG
jgi:hypothetical protein